MANFPENLQGSALTESSTPSKKLGEWVTNEDLQATMMAIIRSTKRNSLQTRGEVSRLYSLTGYLQRRLDLEYLTPEIDHAKENMRVSQSFLCFLYLRNKWVKRKRRKDPETVNQC
ncbi:hypothetical protein FF1_040285 [Malus domestica]